MPKYYTDEHGIREIIDHYERSTDEQLAAEDDAASRLAQAAPDLLDACRIALRELVERGQRKGPVRSSQSATRALRAAIAKAEGWKHRKRPRQARSLNRTSREKR
jgi:hypothetical protein